MKKPTIVRYPWDKWFKHHQFTIEKGKDYWCMTHCMSVQVRQAAIARGFRASIYISNNNSLVIKRLKDA